MSEHRSVESTADCQLLEDRGLSGSQIRGLIRYFGIDLADSMEDLLRGVGTLLEMRRS